MAGGIEKRIDALAARIGARNARRIVITVPTQLVPIEGSVEMDASITEETRAAIDEMLKAIGVSDQDTIIEIARYTGEVPELISVT